MKKINNTDSSTVLFMCYALILCALLFCRPVRYYGMSYMEMLSVNYNIVPFATVDYYISVIQNSSSAALKHNALINLVGNVIMFVPLGAYLPYRFEKLKGFLTFLFLIVFIILAVELIQFFTLLGYCDVDDLILNLSGGVIGFVSYRIYMLKKR